MGDEGGSKRISGFGVWHFGLGIQGLGFRETRISRASGCLFCKDLFANERIRLFTEIGLLQLDKIMLPMASTKNNKENNLPTLNPESPIPLN